MIIVVKKITFGMCKYGLVTLSDDIKSHFLQVSGSHGIGYFSKYNIFMQGKQWGLLPEQFHKMVIQHIFSGSRQLYIYSCVYASLSCFFQSCIYGFGCIPVKITNNMWCSNTLPDTKCVQALYQLQGSFQIG